MTDYTECMVDTILMTYEDLLERAAAEANTGQLEPADIWIKNLQADYGVAGLRELAQKIGEVIELAWKELPDDWGDALLHGGEPIDAAWGGVGCFDWNLVPRCVTQYVYLICVQEKLGTKDTPCTVEQMIDFIKSIPGEG
jgi:hypothetical protein